MGGKFPTVSSLDLHCFRFNFHYLVYFSLEGDLGRLIGEFNLYDKG